MSKTITLIIKGLISVGLAIGLMYLVFQNVDWVDFWERTQTVNYSWVVVSMVLSIVAFVARAYRWNILLEPLGYQLKTSRTLLAVLIGYLANLALPRLGEITRCGVLHRNDGVQVSHALGSVVTERIIDVFTLLFLILISFIIESDRLINFLKTAFLELSIPTYLWLTMAIVGLLGLVALILFVKNQDKLKGKFAALIKEFVAGFLSLKDIKRPWGFLLSTIVLWVVYFLMSYLIVFSLPQTSHLGIGAGFMLLITGGIALALPVQSGFGTYHGMIAGMLMLYAIDHQTGIFLATLLHTSQIVSIALFGGVAVIISMLIRNSRVKKTTN